MEKILMWIIAGCALLGGLDCAFGNRLGLGKKFEDGFRLLGPTALSMAGILCLVPLLKRIFSTIAALVCTPLGFDPSILAGILAIDMGGYQLAQELARTPEAAGFSGIIVAAILGCTVSFTIPIGMGMLKGDARSDFAHGILFGLISMPIGLVIGGCMSGMGLFQTLYQSLPLLLLSLIILLGIWKKADATIRFFTLFARGIFLLGTLGLAFSAFESISGYALIPGLGSLEEAMKVVASVGIVLLGSLPFSELLQRALRRPLLRLGNLTGINPAGTTGLIIGMISVMPAIASIGDMDRRGRIVNAAFMVCAASCFAAHLGFTAGVNPGMLPALLASKLSGGAVAVLLALACTGKISQ